MDKFFRTLSILMPLLRVVDEWLDGNGDEPEVLKHLPDGPLKSELAMERARRRAAV
jgi:hypothetical protein